MIENFIVHIEFGQLKPRYQFRSGVPNKWISRTLFQLLDHILVLQELIGGDHGDAVPRADLVAQGAADAAGEVDGAGLEGGFVPRAGDDADAVDGADDQAGFAAGTHVFIEKGKSFRKFFLGHGYWIVGLDAFDRK